MKDKDQPVLAGPDPCGKLTIAVQIETRDFYSTIPVMFLHLISKTGPLFFEILPVLFFFFPLPFCPWFLSTYRDHRGRKVLEFISPVHTIPLDLLHLIQYFDVFD